MKFWQGKKVFVTGHTGFKGSWLSLWLQSLNAEVIGFSLDPPTNPNLFTAANVAKGMTSIIGDIRDYNSIFSALDEHKPEIIIHMAAQPLVHHSYSEPVETYSINVMGTVHVLEAIRKIDSVKVVINVTTDKCYENNESQKGYCETDRLGGHDPYSNSKACSELVTSAYRNSYFKNQNISLASARAGNVIGGGDWAKDRLIPDIIRAYLNNHSVSIRNPNAVRPWQHVLEPLSGYLLLAERLYEFSPEYSEGWNFGPNEDDIKPVSWIADQVASYLGGHQNWIQDKNPYPHETTYLKLECTKARKKLGWQPRWNLEKGLKETVSWYQDYQSQKNMRDMTLAQIKNFMDTSS